MYFFITLLGWTLVLLEQYTGNWKYNMLGMSYLFASTPILIAWMVFMEWVFIDVIKHLPSPKDLT